mmetsp:Transcript_60739/g.70452  ORF Transcript_60739/g.70452 Transcript_60739/m.70452 type:complete len:128 (+) Transcript_60739:170-553(+)
MPAEGDTYFRRSINWFYGEEAWMQQQVPEDLGKKHVNELLGRHPWHPFDPEMPSSHPCAEQNAFFAQCMGHKDFEDLELHMKHVTCYHPMKVDLMKCLSREKRRAKAAAVATTDSPPSTGSAATASP